MTIWDLLLVVLTIAAMLAVYAAFYAAMLMVPTPWAVALVAACVVAWTLASIFGMLLPFSEFLFATLDLVAVGAFAGMLVRAFGPSKRSGHDYRVGAIGIGVIGAAVALYTALSSAYSL